MHVTCVVRSILAVVSLVISSSLAAAAWPDCEYREVRAYAFNTGGGPDTIIRDKTLNDSVLNRAGELLTPAQIKRLLAALAGPHAKHPVAACFNPRHAFVFYDQAHQPVAWVDVCFECLGARTHPEGAASPYDFPALAELCAELKLPGAPDANFRRWFDEFRAAFASEASADAKSPSPSPGQAKGIAP